MGSPRPVRRAPDLRRRRLCSAARFEPTLADDDAACPGARVATRVRADRLRGRGDARPFPAGDLLQRLSRPRRPGPQPHERPPPHQLGPCCRVRQRLPAQAGPSSVAGRSVGHTDLSIARALLRPIDLNDAPAPDAGSRVQPRLTAPPPLRRRVAHRSLHPSSRRSARRRRRLTRPRIRRRLTRPRIRRRLTRPRISHPSPTPGRGRPRSEARARAGRRGLTARRRAGPRAAWRCPRRSRARGRARRDHPVAGG